MVTAVQPGRRHNFPTLFDLSASLDEFTLTAAQVAEALRVDRQSVYRSARLGRIPYARVGKFIRFRPQDVGVLVEFNS